MALASVASGVSSRKRLRSVRATSIEPRRAAKVIARHCPITVVPSRFSLRYGQVMHSNHVAVAILLMGSLSCRNADKPTAQGFVAYWGNNGHRLALTLNGSGANDPLRT